MNGLRIVPGSLALFDAELATDLVGLAELLDVEEIEEWPPLGGEHDADAVSFFRRSLAAEPGLVEWLAYYVCVQKKLVGTAGFMGAPVGGRVEIGYSICQRYRGRGFATGAVGALIERATTAGAAKLLAHTRPSNTGSILVLERNGFVAADSQRDGYLGFVRELDAARTRQRSR